MSAVMNTRKNAFVARVDVDPDWKVVGQHHATHQPIYEEQRPIFKNVPETDENGNQVWERHPMNNTPSYRKTKVETEMVTHRFWLRDDGNGQVYKQTYVAPSDAEVREVDMAGRKHNLLQDIVNGLAERGKTAEDLISHIFGADNEKPEPSYPVNYSPGRWRLSNGATMQGSKEAAEAAEAALQAPPAA